MKSILVRAPQWLGDAVVSTVFISRLKNRHPDAVLTVLCSGALTDLYSSHPAVGDVISYSSSQGPLAVARLLRPKGFHTAYILPRSFRTAFEAAWARIPERIGFSGDMRGFLLTQSVPYEPRLRYAHRMLKLISEETLPLDQVRPVFPSGPLRPENEIISRFLSGIKKPVLGIGPASVAPARTWEADRFSKLADQFQKETGGTVILFGSKNEKPAAARVAQNLSGAVLDTVGLLTLPELGTVVKKCDAMVVNDSGLMHVASCFDIPTVVLFGASDPAWALPSWGRFRSLQHKEIFCVPCLKNECVRFGSGKYECLKRITVDETWSVLRKELP